MKTFPHPHFPLRRLAFTGLWILLFLAAAACKLQDNAALKSPAGGALEFLGYIPDQPENRKFVAFGDAAAWYTSWNVPRVYSVEEVNNLDDTSRAYWMGAMLVQTYPPDCLDWQSIFSYSIRDAYGFDLFDIDRFIYAGQPPKVVSILEFDTSSQRIANALTKKGYAAEELAPGWVLNSLNKDYELNMQAEMRVEKLGNLNRILLSDHLMIIGKASEVVAPALEAHNDQDPSLADDKTYIASIQALQDPSLKETGELVGVIWMDGAEFTSQTHNIVNMTESQRQDLIEKYGLYNDLPEFSLAAFATRHSLKEGATYLILALVFPKGADAEAASQVLQERLEKANSWRFRTPWLQVLNAADEKVYAVQAGGLPVTLAVFRLDDPELKVINEGSRPMARVRAWMDFVATRDLMFLYRQP